MSLCTPRSYVWSGGMAPFLFYFGSVCRWMTSCISRTLYPIPLPTEIEKKGIAQLKCDGTRVEIRFRLSAKGTSPFKSAGASVQSTAGSRGVRISGSNAGYTVFRGSVKNTATHFIRQFPPSLPLPCVTVCHHISTGLYCWIHHVPR